ncbi:MAG: hypothetical protein AMXMBFR13_47160 [Phycisphaerae bacterium]
MTNGAMILLALSTPIPGQTPATGPESITRLVTDNEELNMLFQRLREVVARDEHVFTLEGGRVRTNPTWVRDHIHELKAFKFWASDLTSYLELLFKHQMKSGAFHEMIVRQRDPHATKVRPEFVHRNTADGYNYVRLELEADIEYLMVEGAYQAWQASGDDDWLRKYLPALEKGMRWAMSDPMRWDERHQLVKRPFTIDTWDFTYGVSDQNRRVEPSTPMAIMHGDNSGMYAACRQLARLNTALGQDDRATEWTRQAEHFRETTHRVCWNGRFYTHQVHLPPSQGVPGVDETKILSLSNAYNINRGLPDHAQAVSILREYRARRDNLAGEYICEWFTIHPPYPMFFTYGPGQYANGALFPLVGGELCKAAFEHEMPAYAMEALHQCMSLIKRHNTLPFALSPEGEVQGGGPRGWGAAAFYSAIVEGLAGVVDEGKLFNSIRLSPRWPAADCRQVQFTARYGPSGATVGYRYGWQPDKNRIELSISGNPRTITGHVLLPSGTQATAVQVDGRPVVFGTTQRNTCSYADFELRRVTGKDLQTDVVIRYQHLDQVDLVR